MTTSDRMPLTLVVKTPNQKVKDIVVNCDLDWSVYRVKQHLSQIYPSRPKITEQKLIYSGRLLTGSELLKDILKHTYDTGQTTHTVHLLCSSSSESIKSGLQHNPPQSSPVPANSTDVSQSGSSEGLRHRHTTHTAQHDAHTSQYQQYAQYYGAGSSLNHGGAEASTMPAMLPGVPYSPEQMMWFQQIYAQQMAQYMQYMQQGYHEANVAVTSAHDPVAHAHHAANAVVVAPPNGEGQNQQMIMNAAGGQAMVDDEDELNRDWLDVTYTLIRFAVLMMIVYFYSTLHRFVMVFGLFCFIWMYQAGWFKLARRNAVERQDEHEEVENENESPQTETTDNENEGDVEVESNRDTETIEEVAENVEPVQQTPGVLRIALSFLVTFWTSLLPAPPPAVNVN